MIHPRKDYQRIQDPAGIIPENEPVFLLRAQDETAAETVRFWIRLNRQRGGDDKLIALASEHYQKMVDWPKKKLADLPADYDARTDLQKKEDGDQPAETVDTLQIDPADGKVTTAKEPEPGQHGEITEAMNYDRQGDPEPAAEQPASAEDVAELQNQVTGLGQDLEDLASIGPRAGDGEKVKSDAAERRKAGNSPW